MPAAETVHSIIFEGNDATCLARIQGTDAAELTQAALTSIAYSVYDRAAPTTSVASGAVVIATSVFDTLQTDARWTADSTGYNFRHTLAGSTFPTGGRTYMVQYKFTETGGSIAYLQFSIKTLEIFGA